MGSLLEHGMKRGHSNTALALVENAKGDWDRDINTQTSAFIEIKPIPELTLRSQVAAVIIGNWSRTFNERTIEWNKEGSTRNSLTEDASWSSNLQWTNTATYTKKFGVHNVTAVVGTEALDQGYGREISVRLVMTTLSPRTRKHLDHRQWRKL